MIQPASTGSRGPIFSAGRGINESTTARTDELTGPVRVTHPFHPLCGQELECVGRRHNWGEDRILYRDSQGYLASLPTGWTSVVPEDPYVVLAGGRSPFRVTDLLELAALVARLRS